MKSNNKLKQRLIAYLLLFSFFLQSCYNFSNPVIPVKKTQAQPNQREDKLNIVQQGFTGKQEVTQQNDEIALESTQSHGVVMDQLRRIQTLSMAQNLRSVLQHLFKPSHSSIERNKLEIEAQQILDNITNPISPISQLLEVTKPSIGASGLKRSESSTIEKLIWATMQYQFPQYFSNSTLTDENSESSDILMSAFIKILQDFTRDKNSPLNQWVSEIKNRIQKGEQKLDQQNASIEFVEASEQFLKYIGSDALNDPLKDPLNKYVKEEIKEAIKLRSWLKSNPRAKDYDKTRQRLEEIEENIRASRFEMIKEISVWMFDLLKRMDPSIPATINNPSEHIVYSEKEFRKKKQEDFFTFLRSYQNNQVNNLFESNRLRAFWEEVAREGYGAILYQTVCESFQANYKESEPHKIIKQIWILSQLDTIHEQPQEARSRMPNSSMEGKPAPNFGYNMGSSPGYQTWVQQPLIGSVGDITVDAFYSILDFGINLNINKFLERLSLHIHANREDKNGYFNNPHPYDRFIHSFESYLLKHVYKQPFIPGKGLTVFEEFDQEELKKRSLAALKTFGEFCKNCRHRSKGFVLGVGFNGKLFDAPTFSFKEDNNEIWLTFSESGRNPGGYLFLELMKDVLRYGTDSPSNNTPIGPEKLYYKYKSLIRLHIDQEIKYWQETPTSFEFDHERLKYAQNNQKKFQAFRSQLQKGLAFQDLSSEFKEWLVAKNYSNWYRIAACNIDTPDELTNADDRVHNESRSIIFDAIVGKFSLSNYPYLINELFIHWKKEVVANIDQASTKEIASAENFDAIPERLKGLTFCALEMLIKQVHQALKDVWIPKIQESFQAFIKEREVYITDKIEKAKQSIIILESNHVNNRITNLTNKGLEKTQLLQPKQLVDKKKQEGLELAREQKDDCENELKQLRQCDIPAKLSAIDYQAFKDYFFNKREISQCIEPIFSKVLGHDRFLSIFISKESAPETRKKLLIVGNGRPQRVIEPCDQRCQFHVLGHLYTGDMLFHQRVDQLDNLRRSHNLGEVPDRFMILGHKNISPRVEASTNSRYTSQSTLQVTPTFTTWDACNIAKELWKNPKAEKYMDELIVNKVNSASTYLEKRGYQLKGVKSDGNCFLNAFLGSYNTLSTKIKTLDTAPNKIYYLRSEIADLDQNNQGRATKIKKDREWIHTQEGVLLAKSLGVPIRLLTVSKDQNEEGVSDMLIFAETGKANQPWDEISVDKKPKEYIFIVEVGHHFLWATLKNTKNTFVTFNKPTTASLNTLTANSQMGHQPQPKYLEWSESSIAQELWKDTNNPIQIKVSGQTIHKVNFVSQYLEERGYQLKGAKADGNCFFHAFVSSYNAISASKKVPLLEGEKDNIDTLRKGLAKSYVDQKLRILNNRFDISEEELIKKKKDIENRGKEILENGEYPAFIDKDEGSLLGKLYQIPIRMLTVNADSDQVGIADMCIFTEYDKDNQEWATLKKQEIPQEYIFIVDIGGHFLWARHKK